MDKSVAELNIEHSRKLLASAGLDEVKGKTSRPSSPPRKGSWRRSKLNAPRRNPRSWDERHL
jgi:hypothetical protein